MNIVELSFALVIASCIELNGLVIEPSDRKFFYLYVNHLVYIFVKHRCNYQNDFCYYL